jgi:ribosomal-protein-alanine N-acetyltransferase
MSDGPSIESMRWWHVDQVAQLESELFAADPWSTEQFWQELAQDSRSYLVAVDDGAVIGYAGAFILPPDSDLQTIAVAADRRGGGLASRMLDRLTETAVAAGCTHMMLEVREDNDPALRLYERLGFERISERPQYYPDGGAAIIMRRRLG